MSSYDPKYYDERVALALEKLIAEGMFAASELKEADICLTPKGNLFIQFPLDSWPFIYYRYDMEYAEYCLHH